MRLNALYYDQHMRHIFWVQILLESLYCKQFVYNENTKTWNFFKPKWRKCSEKSQLGENNIK